MNSGESHTCPVPGCTHRHFSWQVLCAEHYRKVSKEARARLTAARRQLTAARRIAKRSSTVVPSEIVCEALNAQDAVVNEVLS